MKVLVFGASSSKNSINKKFAQYASSLLSDAEISTIDLNDFPLPIYSIDTEKEIGIPDEAKAFSNLISANDGIIMSLAEHNSNFTAVFKNLTDWVSRLEGPLWQSKKLLLLSTSPGKRGGAGVMGIALNNFPYAGGEISGHFSLPSFYENFDQSSGLTDSTLKEELSNKVTEFQNAL